MALRWRVTDIPERDENDNPFWEQGLVRIEYEVYDDAAPQNILYSSNRQFTTETNEQMISLISADIKKLKSSADKRAALIADRAIGASFAVQ